MEEENALVGIFMKLDDRCKEKNLAFSHTLGRKAGLQLSEVWTICCFYQMVGMRDLKRFYCGAYGNWLRQFFPKMPSYSEFLRRRIICGNIIRNTFMDDADEAAYFIIDSTPFKVCETARHSRCRLFKEFAAWAISSTKKYFGIKLHAVLNDKGQAIRIALTKGSVADVTAAAKMLKGLSGSGIGDKGYISKSLNEELTTHGFSLITRPRKNMKRKNTDAEMKLLSERHKIETFFGKLKRKIGESISRFRSWEAAAGSIAIAAASLSLGC
jgi:IS5 family transposase